MSKNSFHSSDEELVKREVPNIGRLEPLRKWSKSRVASGSIRVFVIVIFLTLAVAIGRRSTIRSSPNWLNNLNISFSQVEETWLNAILAAEPKISPKIRYTRRCIVGRRDKTAAHESVTSIDEPLLLGPQTLQLDAPHNRIQQPPCTTIELNVGTPFPQLNMSNFIFGVSTTISRLFDSIPQFARWQANTGARLIVLLSGSSIKTRKAAEKEMTAMGIDSTIVVANDRMGEHKRFLSIVDEIYQRKVSGKTQWLVVMDDDTFFPNMPALVEHMRTEYDPRIPYYIGAQSENQHAVNMYGDEAYGGAGIFISIALAEQMHQFFGACMQHEPTAGDIMIRDCIYQHTNITLTTDDNFHQIDMSGDISGFYESGIRPLSLHHWKSPGFFEALPIASMHLASDSCGDCFLQRWLFTDDVVLTNGFSVVQYPEGIDFDLDAMEETFYQTNIPTRWRFDNLRPRLPPDKKLSYRLLTATKQKDASIRQIYMKAAHEDEAGVKQGDDEIVELLWSNAKHISTDEEDE